MGKRVAPRSKPVRFLGRRGEYATDAAYGVVDHKIDSVGSHFRLTLAHNHPSYPTKELKKASQFFVCTVLVLNLRWLWPFCHSTHIIDFVRWSLTHERHRDPPAPLFRGGR